MTALQFQEELRRIARFELPATMQNPLEAAVQKVQANPALTQSRILGRVLTAIVDGAGEFRRAEASALDSENLRLVVALMNTDQAGSRSRKEWLDAAAAVGAARLHADG